MNFGHRVKWMALALLLAGCSGNGGLLREKLDPVTAVTITTSTTPLIFYRDDNARAAYARDFVYVGPIMVNTMGSYRYFLWFGVWSAIPDAPPAEVRDGLETVTLFADGEPLQLSVSGWTAGAMGASDGAYAKPVASAADAYYEVTMDQVRLMAGSRELRLLTSGPGGKSYELWSNQASALESLRQFAGLAGY